MCSLFLRDSRIDGVKALIGCHFCSVQFGLHTEKTRFQNCRFGIVEVGETRRRRGVDGKELCSA